MTKLVIDNLTPSCEQRLSEWASVQRTINAARSTLLDCRERMDEKKDMHLIDAIELCFEELGDIGPALDALHMAVRPQLWAAKSKK